MALQQYTDLDTNYYEDEYQWGNYQYVVLKDIVSSFMFQQDDDSYLSSVNRNRVILQAKRAVQELYFDVVNEVISIELELNPTLTIPLPHDYVNYVRISWVDENGHLHPLSVNNNTNLAQAYLQDNNYEYLYDDQGDILQGSHVQDLGSPQVPSLPYDYNTYTPNFNLDRSKHFKNGSYRIDKNRGIIQFSSRVEGRTIVLDYISDGLFQRDDSEIRIHKFAEQAVYDYIYWKLTERNRNVPYNEKARARKEWFNNRRIAKRRIKPIRYEEIKQVMKSTSKMIKD